MAAALACINLASKPTGVGLKLQELQRAIWSVNGQDRAILMRCLATTLGSGVGVDRSLDLLSEQTENPDLREACAGMAKLVRSGMYLSVAMGKFPWAFTNLQRRLVQVGERTGALVQVLTRLSIYEEKQVELALKVRSSLTMPILVCILCIGLVVFIPPFLFQGLFRMLQDSNASMPWPTQLLMTFSNLLRSWGFYVFAVMALAGLVSFAIRARRDRGIRRSLMTFMLNVPGLGQTVRLIAVCRFLQSLETMVRVGLPIMVAMEMAGNATENVVLEDALKVGIAQIKEGSEISAGLHATGFFPITVVHSVQVGEQSGKLADMLESLTRLYQVEVDASFDALSKSIEPFVLSIIGAIVGFTVIATMLPMIKLIQNL